jgi:hypothetical protein
MVSFERRVWRWYLWLLLLLLRRKGKTKGGE